VTPKEAGANFEAMMRCSVLQYVAVCCSEEARTFPESSGVLQCVAVCCSVLQCVAACCNALQCFATRKQAQNLRLQVCCSVLQCVAVCCSVLQCVTVCCSEEARTVSET